MNNTSSIATINPYWDEIKDKLTEVVDPYRYLMMRERPISSDLISFATHPYEGIEQQIVDLFGKGLPLRMRRFQICQKYAWAIPDPASVAFVVEHIGPKAVEIGSGAGYWAWQLAQTGVDILAYDIAPPDVVTDNHWCSPRDAKNEGFLHETREVYHPVARGGPEVCQAHADRTLFLCWPYMNEMAAQCLEQYAGRKLVYIGEDQGGCTADDDFFERLGREWDLVAEHQPIQWDGIHDWIYVYDRIAKDL